MDEHCADKQHLTIEMDRRYDSILVPSNIKNVIVTDTTGSIECRFQVG
jgi:hypothetical protein